MDFHLAHAVLFTHPNNVVCRALKGIVVTDDEELGEALDRDNLLGQAVAAGIVQIGRRLVEEGDVDTGQLVEQSQPYR